MLPLIYIVYNEEFSISTDPFLQQILGTLADYIDVIIIVNNKIQSKGHPPGNISGKMVHYMVGTNKDREFGGYLEGLKYLQDLHLGTNDCLVVNDTINQPKHPLEKLILPAISYWLLMFSRHNLDSRIIIGEINRPPRGGGLEKERSQDWVSTYFMLFHGMTVQEISNCINKALERSYQTTLNSIMSRHLDRQLGSQNKLEDLPWYQAKKRSTIVELLFSVELRSQKIRLIDLFSVRWTIKIQYFYFRLKRKIKFLWSIHAGPV
jgi:hypothetical protein